MGCLIPICMLTDLFSRCCWAVSILSLRPWVICILMTLEITFLPLSLHCHQIRPRWAHWFLSLPGKRELSFSPPRSHSPFHRGPYIFEISFHFITGFSFWHGKKKYADYWICHFPRYQPKSNELKKKNYGRKHYARQGQVHCKPVEIHSIFIVKLLWLFFVLFCFHFSLSTCKYVDKLLLKKGCI